MNDGIEQTGIFYTYPQKGVDRKGLPILDRSKAILVKFLVVNGEKVHDSQEKGSASKQLYLRLAPNGRIDEGSRFENSGNYLIVPADYNVSDAIAEADKVNRDMRDASSVGSPLGGLTEGLREMTHDFWPGGSQDLQRGRAWGVPDGEVDPVVKDSASWNFAVTTQLTRIPDFMAEVGAGGLNVYEYARDHLSTMFEGGTATHKVPSWWFGMDSADALNFDAGVRAAKTPAFHQIIIQNSENSIGQVAPVLMPKSGKGAVPNSKAHAADDNVRKAIMTALADFSIQRLGLEGSGYGALTHHASFHSFSEAKSSGFSTDGNDTVPRSAVLTGRSSPNPFGATSDSEGFDAFIRSQPAEFYSDPILSGSDNSTNPEQGLFETGYGDVLPTIAPTRKRSWFADTPFDQIGHQTTATQNPARGVRTLDEKTLPKRSHDARLNAPYEPSRATNFGPVKQAIDKTALAQAMAEIFDQQARLPPSGATGFDPRLTPAWAGQMMMG